MSRAGMGVLAVLAICGLAAPGAADAAKRKPLSIDFVTPGQVRVAPGAAVSLAARVSNTGDRARRPKVRLSLRGERIRASLGSVRPGRVKGHSRLSFTAEATAPRRLSAGEYFAVACVKRRCRSSKQRVRVVAPEPISPASSAPPAPPPPPAPPAVVTDTDLVPIDPPPPAPGDFHPGSRSGGDVLFPQIGNGGYDATHYDLSLQYLPDVGQLIGSAMMTATATQDLSQFSMDLQGFAVLSVAVDGRPAEFSRALPAAASPGAESIRSKLVITPPAGIPSGTSFTVTVFYSGAPETITDPDGGREGWISTETGGVVVCQPIGCQGVYPSNNIPYDKATFDQTIVVPAGMAGIGNGELVSMETVGSLSVWQWKQTEPISTYLTTATVGRYDLTQSTDPAGRPVYRFVDTAANGASPPFTPAQLAGLDAIFARTPGMFSVLGGLLGSYPFGSYGAIVGNAPDVGYALEVATKPFYPSAPGDVYTHVHELAHQWIGDAVTYRQIRDIWIHEGAATWMEWYWGNRADGGPTTAEQFEAAWSDVGFDWSLAPALPTVEEIFAEPIYVRGAMTYEALRQIIGDAGFTRFLLTLSDRYRYGTITTAQLIELAEEVAGGDLTQFFEDYLYTHLRPPRPQAYGAPAVAARSEPNTRTSASRSPMTRGQTRLAR